MIDKKKYELVPYHNNFLSSKKKIKKLLLTLKKRLKR